MTSPDSPVQQKTRELCQVIIAHPQFQTIRQRIDAFQANDDVVQQYQWLNEQGMKLQQKQQAGSPLSDAEVEDFEKKREAFLVNPVATGFLDAQEEIQEIRKSVTQHVSKTFELGRLPAEEDFKASSCGSGCNCH
jgi:cell fate (sporulation/competence/biofilm development) regulator YlbF (YheA/YmcA/DUF963 family)